MLIHVSTHVHIKTRQTCNYFSLLPFQGDCLLFFALFYYSLLFLKFERGLQPRNPPLDPPMLILLSIQPIISKRVLFSDTILKFGKIYKIRKLWIIIPSQEQTLKLHHLEMGKEFNKDFVTSYCFNYDEQLQIKAVPDFLLPLLLFTHAYHVRIQLHVHVYIQSRSRGLGAG